VKGAKESGSRWFESAAREETGEFAFGFGGEGFGSEFAVPTVSAQRGEEFAGKLALVAGGEVGFDVACFAHAGDDGGDIGIGEDETEGELG